MLRPMEELQKLHGLATRCRACQKEYFRTRNCWALEAAKEAERELDALLTDINNRMTAERVPAKPVGRPLMDVFADEPPAKKRP